MPASNESSGRPQRRARGGKRAQRARRAAQQNPTATIRLRPDFNLIADTGDLDAYRDAYERFPKDRDTLRELFADLHVQVYGEPMICKVYRYDDQAGEDTIDSFDEFAAVHIQDRDVAVNVCCWLLDCGVDENVDEHEGVYERYELTNRAKLIGELRVLRNSDPGLLDAIADPGSRAWLSDLTDAAGPVGAELRPDDGRLEATFDAAAYLAAADPNSIVELADSGWGGSYAADEVAQHARAHDPAVEKVLAYCEAASTPENPMGYECAVDAAAALRWLAAARPDAYALVEHTEPVCSGCANQPYRAESGWRGHGEHCDRLGQEPDITRGDLPD